MFKVISLLSVLAFAACGSVDKDDSSHLEGAITSGGMPRACVVGALVGHTYQDADKELTIDFIKRDRATFRLKNDDQIFVVRFDLTMNCELTLKDSIAPTLGGKGRLFWMRADGSQIFDSVTRTELKKIK